ncbi:MAG: hypothetical protein GY708_23020 [Actinomycetia bacterium]|nr:hypothetical protein [Actinomycetes bacterium]
MTRTKRTVFAVIVAVTVLAGACGSDDGDSSGSADDFEGMSLTIGSKNFTEQYVLSEILIQGLIARGAEVTDRTDTGDTPTTRAALLGGEIDAYWEYNSTGWVEHLGNGSPDDDAEELTDDVRAADRQNGIEWLGRSTFNDTYGFAVGPELAADVAPTRVRVDKFDLDDMADYLEDDGDAVVCVEPEFPDRADGLTLFEDNTGFVVPRSQLRVFDDAGDVYSAVQSGECDFGEVFTTDGRIDSLDLTLVVDGGVFYVYNVSLNIPTAVYQQAPEAFDDLVGDILRPLSQVRMTALNREVTDGVPVSQVAARYLDTFEINP